MKFLILMSLLVLLWDFSPAYAKIQSECDPFTAHCRIQALSLKNYPFEEISLSGTITTSLQKWTLMSTPDQHYFLAALHDHISLQDLEIIQITKDRIFLKNNEGKNFSLTVQRSLLHDNNEIQ